MKNMKINKRVTALTLATTITLLTGCTGKKEKSETIEPQETTQPVEFCLSDEQTAPEQLKDHTHLIIYFGEQVVILRECEGYDINYNSWNGSSLNYEISNSNLGLNESGTVKNYHCYTTNHQDFQYESENLAIEKGAKVLKIK